MKSKLPENVISITKSRTKKSNIYTKSDLIRKNEGYIVTEFEDRIEIRLAPFYYEGKTHKACKIHDIYKGVTISKANLVTENGIYNIDETSNEDKIVCYL